LIKYAAASPSAAITTPAMAGPTMRDPWATKNAPILTPGMKNNSRATRFTSSDRPAKRMPYMSKASRSGQLAARKTPSRVGTSSPSPTLTFKHGDKSLELKRHDDLVFASGNVNAQAKKDKRSNSRVVPVLNRDSGKLEAVLLLEPATAGSRWRFGKTTLEATYGLQTGDSLALLCDRRNGVAPAIGQLASNCVLASVDDDKPGSGSRHANAGVSLARNGGKLGLSFGTGRDTLPAWLTPGQAGPARYNQNDFSLFAEKAISREGFVSVGGTVARARLVPARQLDRSCLPHGRASIQALPRQPGWAKTHSTDFRSWSGRFSILVPGWAAFGVQLDR